MAKELKDWIIEKEEIKGDFIDFYLKSSDDRKVKYRYSISKDEADSKKIGSECYTLEEYEKKISKLVIPRIKEILEKYK